MRLLNILCVFGVFIGAGLAQTDTELCLKKCTKPLSTECGGASFDSSQNVERLNACSSVCKADPDNIPVCARACGAYIMHRVRVYNFVKDLQMDDICKDYCPIEETPNSFTSGHITGTSPEITLTVHSEYWIRTPDIDLLAQSCYNCQDNYADEVCQNYNNIANINAPNLQRVGPYVSRSSDQLERPFHDCHRSICRGSGMRHFNMPKLEIIGEYAFARSSIQTLHAPNVQHVGAYAFYSSKIQRIDLPKLNHIGERVFVYAMSLVYFKADSLEYMHERMFSSSPIEYVDLPSMTIIPYSAFRNSLSNTPNMRKVNIPNVKVIERYGFGNNIIEHVYAPSLRKVESYAFADSVGLKTFYAPNLVDIEVDAFHNGGTRWNPNSFFIFASPDAYYWSDRLPSFTTCDSSTCGGHTCIEKEGELSETRCVCKYGSSGDHCEFPSNCGGDIVSKCEQNLQDTCFGNTTQFTTACKKMCDDGNLNTCATVCAVDPTQVSSCWSACAYDSTNPQACSIACTHNTSDIASCSSACDSSDAMACSSVCTLEPTNAAACLAGCSWETPSTCKTACSLTSDQDACAIACLNDPTDGQACASGCSPSTIDVCKHACDNDSNDANACSLACSTDNPSACQYACSNQNTLACHITCVDQRRSDVCSNACAETNINGTALYPASCNILCQDHQDGVACDAACDADETIYHKACQLGCAADDAEKCKDACDIASAKYPQACHLSCQDEPYLPHCNAACEADSVVHKDSCVEACNMDDIAACGRLCFVEPTNDACLTGSCLSSSPFLCAAQCDENPTDTHACSIACEAGVSPNACAVVCSESEPDACHSACQHAPTPGQCAIACDAGNADSCEEIHKMESQCANCKPDNGHDCQVCNLLCHSKRGNYTQHCASYCENAYAKSWDDDSTSPHQVWKHAPQSWHSACQQYCASEVRRLDFRTHPTDYSTRSHYWQRQSYHPEEHDRCRYLCNMVVDGTLIFPGDVWDAADKKWASSKPHYECFHTVIMPYATRINEYAFVQSSTIKHVEAPMVTKLGYYAFGYSSLETIYMPNIKDIGRFAFSDSSHLHTIGYTPHLDTIRYGAFKSTGITAIGMNPSTYVGDYAFISTPLETSWPNAYPYWGRKSPIACGLNICNGQGCAEFPNGTKTCACDKDRSGTYCETYTPCGLIGAEICLGAPDCAPAEEINSFCITSCEGAPGLEVCLRSLELDGTTGLSTVLESCRVVGGSQACATACKAQLKQAQEVDACTSATEYCLSHSDDEDTCTAAHAFCDQGQGDIDACFASCMAGRVEDCPHVPKITWVSTCEANNLDACDILCERYGECEKNERQCTLSQRPKSCALMCKRTRDENACKDAIHFCNVENSRFCQPCPAGTMKAHDASCQYCPLGTYSDGHEHCVRCPVGTRGTEIGAMSNKTCVACEGHTVSVPDRSTCVSTLNGCAAKHGLDNTDGHLSVYNAVSGTQLLFKVGDYRLFYFDAPTEVFKIHVLQSNEAHSDILYRAEDEYGHVRIEDQGLLSEISAESLSDGTYLYTIDTAPMEMYAVHEEANIVLYQHCSPCLEYGTNANVCKNDAQCSFDEITSVEGTLKPNCECQDPLRQAGAFCEITPCDPSPCYTGDCQPKIPITHADNFTCGTCGEGFHGPRCCPDRFSGPGCKTYERGECWHDMGAPIDVGSSTGIAMSLSPDGKQLAVASNDNVRIYDYEDIDFVQNQDDQWHVQSTISLPGVKSLSWSEDNTKLIFATSNIAYIWNNNTLAVFTSSQAPIQYVQFVGTQVVVRSSENVRMFDQTETELWSAVGYFSDIGCSQDVCLAVKPGEILWLPINAVLHVDDAQTVSVSSDGNTFAVGSPEASSNIGKVRVFEKQDGASCYPYQCGQWTCDEWCRCYAEKERAIYTSNGCALTDPSSCDCSGVYVKTQEYLGSATTDLFGSDISTTKDTIAISSAPGGVHIGDVHIYTSGAEVFRVDCDSQDQGHFGHIVQLSEDASVMAIADPLMDSGNGQVRVLHVDACITRASCPKGYKTRLDGTCIPCSPGSYQDQRGQTVCKPCPSNTYAQSTASHRCQPCAKTDGIRCAEDTTPTQNIDTPILTIFMTQDHFRDAIHECLAEDPVSGNCVNFAADTAYGIMSDWNTALITDMSSAFEDRVEFNGDLSRWETGAVTTMARMFKNAHAFDQSIESWHVQNVVNVEQMFYMQSGIGLSEEHVAVIQNQFEDRTAVRNRPTLRFHNGVRSHPTRRVEEPNFNCAHIFKGMRDCTDRTKRLIKWIDQIE